ncbi:DoxX family protein [Nocardia sp. NPDC056100]|uniref:DoxX family protein n=1 Tax=Nocardia sp. NPDC056100 TaxID=3345712 RepID=UPI0035DD8EE7
MDAGLLFLRVALAVLIAGHGCQKLFGWFSGSGPRGTGAVFEKWGLRPGPAMAVVAGATEVLGAVLFAGGLFTAAGTALIVGTMVVAVAMTAANGLWANKGGCELALLYGLTAFGTGLAGPGRYSLDHALGLERFAGPGYVLGASFLALIGGAGLVILARLRTAREIPAQ